MSGFGGNYGGIGGVVDSLQNNVRPPADADTLAGPRNPQGAAPGEPTNMGATYGQQGAYNTMATDMSRGYMGGYGFSPRGMFQYSPFGNPYYRRPSPPPPPPPSPSSYRFGGGFGGGGFGGFGGMPYFGFGGGNRMAGRWW